MESGVNVSCTVSLVPMLILHILHYCIQKPEDVAGSTLLQVIDKFALNNHNVSHPVTSDNIGIVCQIQERE